MHEEPLRKQGRIKRNFFWSFLIQMLFLFIEISYETTVPWNDSVVIPDIQYSTLNYYNESSLTPITLQKAYLTDSNSLYIAASAGSNAIFSKQNAAEEQVWAKSYTNFPFYHQSFIVAMDDSVIVWVEEGSATSVRVITIDPNNGGLVNQYIE